MNGEMIVWLNGEFAPLSRAAVSPLDRGLLFGDGLFTTLRAQAGRPLHLERHLARLQASAAALGLAMPEQDWAGLAVGLLARNGLAKGPARLKLVLTRGPAPGPGLPPPVRPTLLMLAEPYQPPTEEEYVRGWRLHVYRQGHAPPLAGHKSLNYLYHLAARQAALEAGADEAVLLSPGGEVAETSMGSLLVHDGRAWATPAGPYLLPGVTLGLVREALAGWGEGVAERALRPEDLAATRCVWVLSSLMGVMPARSVDGRALPETRAELAARVRARLFGGD